MSMSTTTSKVTWKDNDPLISINNLSGSQASISSLTDNESYSKNSDKSATPGKDFEFPTLTINGILFLDTVMKTANYGLYLDVPFEDKKKATITCYFFVFCVFGSKYLGPGTRFSSYSHPNGKGMLFFYRH